MNEMDYEDLLNTFDENRYTYDAEDNENGQGDEEADSENDIDRAAPSSPTRREVTIADDGKGDDDDDNTRNSRSSTDKSWRLGSSIQNNPPVLDIVHPSSPQSWKHRKTKKQKQEITTETTQPQGVSYDALYHYQQSSSDTDILISPNQSLQPMNPPSISQGTTFFNDSMNDEDVMDISSLESTSLRTPPSRKRTATTSTDNTNIFVPMKAVLKNDDEYVTNDDLNTSNIIIQNTSTAIATETSSATVTPNITDSNGMVLVQQIKLLDDLLTLETANFSPLAVGHDSRNSAISDIGSDGVTFGSKKQHNTNIRAYDENEDDGLTKELASLERSEQLLRMELNIFKDNSRKDQINNIKNDSTMDEDECVDFDHEDADDINVPLNLFPNIRNDEFIQSHDVALSFQHSTPTLPVRSTISSNDDFFEVDEERAIFGSNSEEFPFYNDEKNNKDNNSSNMMLLDTPQVSNRSNDRGMLDHTSVDSAVVLLPSKVASYQSPIRLNRTMTDDGNDKPEMANIFDGKNDMQEDDSYYGSDHQKTNIIVRPQEEEEDSKSLLQKPDSKKTNESRIVFGLDSEIDTNEVVVADTPLLLPADSFAYSSSNSDSKNPNFATALDDGSFNSGSLHPLYAVVESKDPTNKRPALDAHNDRSKPVVAGTTNPNSSDDDYFETLLNRPSSLLSESQSSTEDGGGDNNGMVESLQDASQGTSQEEDRNHYFRSSNQMKSITGEPSGSPGKSLVVGTMSTFSSTIPLPPTTMAIARHVDKFDSTGNSTAAVYREESIPFVLVQNASSDSHDTTDYDDSALLLAKSKQSSGLLTQRPKHNTVRSQSAGDEVVPSPSRKQDGPRYASERNMVTFGLPSSDDDDDADDDGSNTNDYDDGLVNLLTIGSIASDAFEDGTINTITVKNRSSDVYCVGQAPVNSLINVPQPPSDDTNDDAVTDGAYVVGGGGLTHTALLQHQWMWQKKASGTFEDNNNNARYDDKLVHLFYNEEEVDEDESSQSGHVSNPPTSLSGIKIISYSDETLSDSVVSGFEDHHHHDNNNITNYYDNKYTNPILPFAIPFRFSIHRQDSTKKNENNNNTNNTQSKDTTTFTTSSRRKTLVPWDVLTIGCLLLIIVIAVAVVASTKNNHNGTDTDLSASQTRSPSSTTTRSSPTRIPSIVGSSSNDVATNNPTILLVGSTIPTIVPSNVVSTEPTWDYDDLFRLLVSISFDNGTALKTFNLDVPQFQAYDWLSRNRYLGLYSEQQLIQRYSMAVLFYSTNGENWIQNDLWLSDDDECYWYSHYTSIPPCGSLNTTNRTILHLDLNNNNLNGTIPMEIALLQPTLVSLYLAGGPQSTIRGTIPTEIGLLTQLQELWLHNNHIEGTIPTSIGQLSQLRDINLSHNKFSGTIPTEIGNCISLTEVALRNNRLNGTLPSSIGRLQSIRLFTVSTNRLTSTIPTELGNWSRMYYFDVSHNSFNGTIPSEVIGTMQFVRTFTVSNNALHGPIPTQFGFMKRLVFLDLSSNQLTGSIPSTMIVPNPTNNRLLSFHIENNPTLSGSIPSSFQYLTRIQTILLHGTNVTGTMPSQACTVFDRTNPNIFINCININCPCCNYCCTADGNCQCKYNTSSSTDETNGGVC